MDTRYHSRDESVQCAASCPDAPTPSFLKWAGSKQRLLAQLLPLLPAGRRLVEPFVGAAHVFLATHYTDALLADTNPVLMELFRALQENPEGFVRSARKFFTEGYRSPEAFGALRARYNACGTSMAERVAIFLYLNKFGFNGLYRENGQGQFNAPYGHPARVPNFPEAAVLACALRLRGVTLRCQSFEATLAMVRPGDVVYADPPYADREDRRSFTAYRSAGFGRDDHLRLAEHARQLARSGIPVVISNHDTPDTRALYAGAEFHRLVAYRSMAACSKARCKTAELVAVFR